MPTRSGARTPVHARHEIKLTRESLADGSLRNWLAASNPELKVWSDEQMQASIADMLANRPDGAGDVWIFAYGSLIWNPIIRTVEHRIADVRGFHRRFCLWTHLGRGTAECPGLMLALERGGSCRGLVYRIAEAEMPEELMLLWRREMVTGAYCPRWVKAATPVGPVYAIAFAINAAHHRYAGRLPDAQIAATIARAEGPLGRCCHYLFSTVEHLHQLGIRDRHLEHLARQVEGLQLGGAIEGEPPTG